MRLQDKVLKPIVTEKAIGKGGNNEYVFQTSLAANKHMIAEAIEKLFNVEVQSVKTMIVKGKSLRVGRQRKVKVSPNIKKAYITLKKGSIDIVPKA